MTFKEKIERLKNSPDQVVNRDSQMTLVSSQRSLREVDATQPRRSPIETLLAKKAAQSEAE